MCVFQVVSVVRHFRLEPVCFLLILFFLICFQLSLFKRTSLFYKSDYSIEQKRNK